MAYMYGVSDRNVTPGVTAPDSNRTHGFPFTLANQRYRTDHQERNQGHSKQGTEREGHRQWRYHATRKRHPNRHHLVHLAFEGKLSIFAGITAPEIPMIEK